MITFDEEKHKYHNQFGVEYISVTTLLGEFKKPFDAAKHAQRVAEREGVTTDSVLQSWKTLTEQSHEKGKAHHKAMENYIRFGDIDPQYLDLINSLNKATDGFKATTKTAERLLWHDSSHIAGMADLILENDKEFFVMDFKTNKKFTFSNKYGERLLPPLDFLDYCEFTLYTLQLSMYAWMMEQSTGKHCKGMKILYLANNSFTNKKYWREIPVIYCRDTISNIVKIRQAKIQHANT